MDDQPTRDEGKPAGYQPASMTDPTMPEPEPKPKSFFARWWLLIAIVVFVLVGIAASLAAGDDDTSTENESVPELELAQNICADGSGFIVVGDSGMTLTIVSEGEESPGAPIEQIGCVLVALGVPDSVLSQIDRTTSMQGVQRATWSDFEASWTYHPDNGLNMIVEQVP
jgi:hypothetical protein